MALWLCSYVAMWLYGYMATDKTNQSWIGGLGGGGREKGKLLETKREKGKLPKTTQDHPGPKRKKPQDHPVTKGKREKTGPRNVRSIPLGNQTARTHALTKRNDFPVEHPPTSDIPESSDGSSHGLGSFTTPLAWSTAPHCDGYADQSPMAGC